MLGIDYTTFWRPFSSLYVLFLGLPDSSVIHITHIVPRAITNHVLSQGPWCRSNPLTVNLYISDNKKVTYPISTIKGLFNRSHFLLDDRRALKDKNLVR